MPEGESSAVGLAPRVVESRGMLDARYEVYGEIASGGMASVQYGRLIGPRGFTRAVAIKRLHPHFAREPDFVAMFVDEARLSARLVHANIIPTLDVVETPGELALVMEYVHGESLWALLKMSATRDQPVPVRVACALIASVLYGLHAAHDTRNESGDALGIVHRDVSPQNILVGADGIPRVLDFGIAKAIGRLRSTPSGEIKGKLSYISPEQLHGMAVDRRADVYGASAVLWEILTGHALFDGPNESAIVHSVLHDVVEPPSAHHAESSPELDAIVLRGLDRDPAARFATAREMAIDLERHVGLATQSEISDWLHALAGDELARRAQRLQRMQDSASLSTVTSNTPSNTRRIEHSDRPPAPELLPASSPPESPPERRISRSARLSLIALAILGAVAWLLIRSSDNRGMAAPSAVERAEPAPSPAGVQTSASAASVPPPSAAEASDTAATPPPSAAELVPSVEPSEPPATVKPAPEPLDKSKPAGSPGHAVKTKLSKKSQCTPYFYIDAMGIRRPKPECL